MVQMDFDPRQSARLTRSLPASGQYTIVPVDDESDLDLTGTEIIPPTPSARFWAALSYLGAFSIVIFVAQPRRRFTRLHNRTAVPLHVLRFLWVAGALAAWWKSDTTPGTDYGIEKFGADVGLLLLAGFPRVSVLQSDAFAWIIWPLVVTWVCSVIGFGLSLSGGTADFRAFAHANWNDIVRREDDGQARAKLEKSQARMARQRQLDRLQRTTKVMGVERGRRERSRELDDTVQRLQAEREHINQLLALGEISRRRYDSISEDIDREIGELRGALNEITARSDTQIGRIPGKMRVGRLDRAPESEVDTIAIVTPSGVPLFTYGTFQLDEALVAGILSAFDSITEEVFGSRVHKTELAEGQVLHFAHGQHVVVLAIFTEEPSPKQVQQLRQMLQHFEAANAGPLSRLQYDPDFLHQVAAPFTFHDHN